jgi:hypothetical protein
VYPQVKSFILEHSLQAKAAKTSKPAAALAKKPAATKTVATKKTVKK